MGLDLSRRTVLKGLGVSMALPWLEAMGPLKAWAAEPTPDKAVPNRMAFLYVPNGKNMADWTPKAEGADQRVHRSLLLLGSSKIMAVLNNTCMHANLPLIPFDAQRLLQQGAQPPPTAKA